jgi:hypothetical protein
MFVSSLIRHLSNLSRHPYTYTYTYYKYTTYYTYYMQKVTRTKVTIEQISYANLEQTALKFLQ